jgi:hypothetical protein
MTVPHYGKREPGALTAASPGDTLYFNFASYNDSGNSEVLSGLAVTDIEVIKNGAATVRATDSGYSLISDTGMVGDRAGLYRCSIALYNTADDASFYASGAWYQAFVDAVTIDGKTVRFWLGSWEIGRQKVNTVELNGDTGAANWLKSTYANGFADTGLYDTIADYDTGTKDRLGKIGFDVDTGLRVHIDDSDTGIKDTLADLDSGLRGILLNVTALDSGLKDTIADLDSGLRDFITDAKNELDTGGVNVTATVDTGVVNQAVWQGNASRVLTANTNLGGLAVNVTQVVGDTGAGVHLKRIVDEYDTGRLAAEATATLDTGAVNQAVWGANTSRTLTSFDVDSGLRDLIADLDTGIRALLALRDTGAIATAVWAGDTGLRDHIANVDTGLTNRLSIIAFDVDTGLRAQISDVDTGIHDILAKQDTGAVATAVWAGDTGLRDHIVNVDTGLTNRLSIIAFDVDTGLRAHISDVDTGLHAVLALQDTGAIATAVWAGDTGLRDHITNADTGLTVPLAAIKAKTDSLTFTVAGVIDSNIQYVNDTQVAGTGDTGAGNPWRPA